MDVVKEREGRIWGVCALYSGRTGGGAGIEGEQYEDRGAFVYIVLCPILCGLTGDLQYTVVLYPFAAPEMQFAGGMGRDTILREQLVDIDETIC